MTPFVPCCRRIKIAEHRQRALNPEHPVIRGTSANPDTYFQSREATNPWYDAVYEHVETAMNDFATATGRQYKTVRIFTVTRRRNGLLSSWGPLSAPVKRSLMNC